MRLVSLILCLVLAQSAFTQTPPPPKPTLPDVHLPNPPAPAPVPVPGAPVLLKTGVSYVITATSPVAVLASPVGVVTIDAAMGPLRISGIFSDGKGVRETRTYTQPNLYIVEATDAGGACEVLVVKSLADRTSDVRQGITTTPLPPVPPPDPPAPVDPITQAMSDALKADGQPASVAAALARVYRTAALGILSTTDKTYGTLANYGALFSTLKPIQDAAVPPATIAHLRTIVGQQFATALGATTADPINRTLTANTFNSIAQHLEGVK